MQNLKLSHGFGIANAIPKFRVLDTIKTTKPAINNNNTVYLDTVVRKQNYNDEPIRHLFIHKLHLYISSKILKPSSKS